MSQEMKPQPRADGGHEVSTLDLNRLVVLVADGKLTEEHTTPLVLALQELLRVREAKPKPAVLFCQHCGKPHVDKLESSGIDWSKRSHRTHLCHHCGKTWQPFDFPTYGVALPEPWSSNPESPVKQLYDLLHQYLPDHALESGAGALLQVVDGAPGDGATVHRLWKTATGCQTPMEASRLIPKK